MESKVKPPAVALAVVAGLGLVLALIGLALRILSWSHPETWRIDFEELGVEDRDVREALESLQTIADGPIGAAWSLVQILVCVFVLFAAVRMATLRGWSLAAAASALALVPCLTPCCCCLFNLPVAIWCLVVLFQPDVRSAFRS